VLHGRALVVLAAEQYASRLVLPARKRVPATHWASHKNQAAKSLAKLAAPHILVSLTKLERALEQTHRAYNRADTAASAERDPQELDEGEFYDDAALDSDDDGEPQD
jgi:hypothetical protein